MVTTDPWWLAIPIEQEGDGGSDRTSPVDGLAAWASILELVLDEGASEGRRRREDPPGTALLERLLLGTTLLLAARAMLTGPDEAALRAMLRLHESRPHPDPPEERRRPRRASPRSGKR